MFFGGDEFLGWVHVLPVDASAGFAGGEAEGEGTGELDHFFLLEGCFSKSRDLKSEWNK